jgi:formylmethanofuran dehydrogenase subunit E
MYDGNTALHFKNAGKAANFFAERLKDERVRLGKVVEGKMDKDEQERNTLFMSGSSEN